MGLDAIIPDAMYDTATAGELMGGINRRDVCILIREGVIQGYKRPAVRSKHGAGRPGKDLVVPGSEILRFNDSMEPVSASGGGQATLARKRRRSTARPKLPRRYGEAG